MFKSAPTLYQHLFRTILAAMLIQLILAMITAITFLMYPVLSNSADDLAQLIVETTAQWPTLSTTEQTRFADEIQSNNELLIQNDAPMASQRALLPYVWLLEYKLGKRLQQPVKFFSFESDTTWYWASIPSTTAPIYISFSRERIGTRPPQFFMAALIFSIALSIITSLYLARHITSAIRHLVKASKQLAQGQLPDEIPETGSDEMRLLTSSFNQMTKSVKELLDNRTTLLVGVSHNLRSPLARLHLALELLPDNLDPQLRQKIYNSIDEMDDTIGQFLNLAHGMNRENASPCRLSDLTKNVISNLQRNNQLQLHVIHDCEIIVPQAALHQVLINITENALAYGEGKPVIIEVVCRYEDVFIHVIDQGPGIPPDMVDKIFQPFVRATHNRRKGTGLGLAIASLICKAHHWTLQLNPGKPSGTVACLHIPRHLSNPQYNPQKQPPQTH